MILLQLVFKLTRKSAYFNATYYIHVLILLLLNHIRWNMEETGDVNSLLYVHSSTILSDILKYKVWSEASLK